MQRPPVRGDLRLGVDEIVGAGATIEKDALAAFGPLLLADSATVADEGDVEVVVLVGRELGFEHVVCREGGDLGADESESNGDSVDVGVDGQCGSAKGEEQNAGGGLGPDAGQLGQPLLGLVDRHVFESGGVPVGAEAISELGEQGLHSRGFGPGQASGADGVFQLLDRCFEDGVPVEVALEQRLKCASGVGVGGVLRKESEDEFGDRIVGRTPGRERGFLDQSLDDRGGAKGLGATSASGHWLLLVSCDLRSVAQQHDFAVIADVVAGEEQVQSVDLLATLFADGGAFDHIRFRWLVIVARASATSTGTPVGTKAPPDKGDGKDECGDSCFHAVNVIER